jgi:hypothetical protein
VVVALVLISSVVASLLFGKETESNIHVDLPPDFDGSLADYSPSSGLDSPSHTPEVEGVADGGSNESEDQRAEKVHKGQFSH